MLEIASQRIACVFDAWQGLLNVPSQVCSIATCGWAYIGKRGFECTLVPIFHHVHILSEPFKYELDASDVLPKVTFHPSLRQ